MIQEHAVQQSSTVRKCEMEWAMKTCMQAIAEVASAKYELECQKNFRFSFDDKKQIEDFIEVLERATEQIKGQS